MRNKKYILWSLLVGMLCMSAEQARADFFYDDNGEFTYEGYTFIGAATIAVAAGTYATYRYLYPPKDQAVVKQSSQKNKTIDSVSLISMVLAAEVMAIMLIDGEIEEYIYQPIRKKKTIDDFLKQKLLDRENELEWKRRNGVNYYTILTEQQKNELLEIKLQQIKTSDSIKIAVVARLTKDYSYDRLIKFIEDAGTLAIKKNNGILEISHINMIFNDVNVGPQVNENYFSRAAILETAYHEAGHAFVQASKGTKFILHEVTIEPRRDAKSQSSNPFRSQFDNQYEIRCIVGLCRLIPISQDAYDAKTLTEDDLEYEIMILLAGGVSEQVADLPCQLQEKDREHGSLSDFLARRSRASQDINQAHVIALEMVRLQYVRNGIQNLPEQSKIMKDRDKIIADIYPKTYKFVKEHRSDIKKIAMLLMAKKTVSGDEVHNHLGVPRKKYDFEQDHAA